MASSESDIARCSACPVGEDALTNSDDVKGKVKEAAGDLTGDKDLQSEGKTDQAAGSAKEKISNVVDSVKDKVEDVLHKDK